MKKTISIWFGLLLVPICYGAMYLGTRNVAISASVAIFFEIHFLLSVYAAPHKGLKQVLATTLVACLGTVAAFDYYTLMTNIKLPINRYSESVMIKSTSRYDYINKPVKEYYGQKVWNDVVATRQILSPGANTLIFDSGNILFCRKFDVIHDSDVTINFINSNCIPDFETTDWNVALIKGEMVLYEAFISRSESEISQTFHLKPGQYIYMIRRAMKSKEYREVTIELSSVVQ